MCNNKNTNFSLANTINSEDVRQASWRKQRLERGFDDTELWNLDITILKFILPRLKAFKENTCGYPTEFKNLKDWQECIQNMIDSIEYIIKDDETTIAETYKGFEDFKKYFFCLWW